MSKSNNHSKIRWNLIKFFLPLFLISKLGFGFSEDTDNGITNMNTQLQSQITTKLHQIKENEKEIERLLVKMNSHIKDRDSARDTTAQARSQDLYDQTENRMRTFQVQNEVLESEINTARTQINNSNAQILAQRKTTEEPRRDMVPPPNNDPTPPTSRPGEVTITDPQAAPPLATSVQKTEKTPDKKIEIPPTSSPEISRVTEIAAAAAATTTTPTSNSGPVDPRTTTNGGCSNGCGGGSSGSGHGSHSSSGGDFLMGALIGGGVGALVGSLLSNSREKSDSPSYKGPQVVNLQTVSDSLPIPSEQPAHLNKHEYDTLVKIATSNRNSENLRQVALRRLNGVPLSPQEQALIARID